MSLKYTIEHKPKSVVHISVTVPAEKIQSAYDKTLAELLKTAKMDGFREGHVPAEVYLARVGTMHIWEESLSRAIPDVYIEIVTSEKIAAIGKPSIRVTKIADKSDAEIEIETATMPTVKLGKYTDVAKKVFKEKSPDISVTDTELNDAILNLRKMKFQSDAGKAAENPTDVPSIESITEDQLPEFTDEIVQSFGPEFKTVDDLKTRLKHNLEHEKTHRAEEELRTKLIEGLVADSTVEIPDILIDHEVERVIAEFSHEVTMSGIAFDEYLKHIGKTPESMRVDMRPRAETRVKLQLILEELAKVESIKPDEEKIKTELEAIKKQYENNPDFSPGHAESYLTEVYTNQAVFKWLEDKAGYKPHVCTPENK